MKFEDNQSSNSLSIDAIFAKLPNPVLYKPESYGFNEINSTGNGIKICVIDSGVPDHDAIKNIGGHVNFTSSESFRDNVGHSTVLSGLIAANKADEMQGMAPDSILYYAKCTNDEGNAQYDAIIACVLWGIVKDVKIILIPMVLDMNFSLQDAMTKAFDSGICVIMSAPENNVKYANCLYVSPIFDNNRSHFSGPRHIKIPAKDLYTTYLEQSYAKVTGGACSGAIATAVCSLLIDRNRTEKAPDDPSTIFKQMVQQVSTEVTK